MAIMKNRSSKLWSRSRAVLHPDMPVDMFIDWPEGIVDLGIIKKEFLE